MKYPNISVMPRISKSGRAFSVEVRHDNEGDWETYFNGDDHEMGMKVLNECLSKWADYPLYIDEHEVNVKGYLFKVKTVKDGEENVRKFFKPLDKVRNKF